MAEMKMKEIPEDVLIDVLSYLPVKSLMRFNCVCKAWGDLFRNPDFITKHYHNRATLGKSNISVLVKHSDHGEDCFSFLSSTVNEDGSETIRIAESIYVPFYGNFLRNPRVMGPCNGLLCLVDYGIYGKIALWNPAIREFKLLPWSIESSAGMGITFSLEEVGFGFDSKNNDYKVIAFVSSLDRARTVYRAELYSLTSESWREIPSWGSILPIEEFSFGFALSNAYYSHGVYYWLIGGYYVDTGDWIISFDMADEVFEIMQLPDFGVSGLTHFIEFEILDASIIAVVCPNNPGGCFDIWVMNEPGVKRSWVKRDRIAPISGIKNPVGFWKSGELCFEDSSNQLVLYDSSTQQVKNLPLHGARYSSQVVNYMESLVQINGKRGNAGEPIVRIRNRNL
ncbi:F-box and associated interaction domains-containing protein putative isoform 1 [Tripterygium wilfordii]|uniref:F-box and associated interaction domains-containing protein putative isoform 1 n=1 Tax=Tripterygium wilfordii TaxID=458696 RepID=A0A7J7CFL8_TRIWF|nr:F-box/kelch-repeat protein At3g23880-like [Tripterygium wilfordii]KAF5732929.1 F-box and associated interaction domains-containing protein putative isoform 1 [Tripterygium wilfordii]